MDNENSFTPDASSDEEKFDPIVFQEKVAQELLIEDRFQNYFAEFNPDSVKNFIADYARRKTLWYQYGDFNVKQNESDSLKWIEAASAQLETIQQKKLFDLQCQWRAEKITLPEIEICYDFEVWGKDVLTCPFIEPITEQEIDLYMQYLLQNNVELELGWLSSWQDYDEIKEAYNSDNESSNFPEWYDFHNGRTGASAYMLLPNIRGEKENFYIELFRHKTRLEIKAQRTEILQTRDNRPFVKSIWDADFLQWFVMTFEDSQTREYYKAEQSQRLTDDEGLEENIAVLLKADEPIAIEAHHNWKEAIARAVEHYRNKKIADYLTLAFEQYQLNVGLGIMPSNECLRKEYLNTREEYAKQILGGREINGEPRDLNF